MPTGRCNENGPAKFAAFSLLASSSQFERDATAARDAAAANDGLMRRRACKYGHQCYRTHNNDHCARFAHPGDPEWRESCRAPGVANVGAGAGAGAGVGRAGVGAGQPVLPAPRNVGLPVTDERAVPRNDGPW